MKVAIIRRNGLGDLLCAYPLVLYFRKYYPKASLTLFVDSYNCHLASYLPPVDELVVLPRNRSKYISLFRIAMRYRGKFDWAISAKTSPMKLMNLFLFWLGAKKRSAYVDGSWHSRLINHPLFPRKERLHQAVKSLHIVDPKLEKVEEELFPTLHIPESKQCALPKLTPDVVLITASTSREASRLQADRYAGLLNRLRENHSFSVLIVGQKKDKERAHSLAEKIQVPHALIFPRDFDEFIQVLDIGDLYFVGDGGVAHLGAALKKKGVVLYGETHPAEWAPLSPFMTTLYHPTHVNCLSDETIFEALLCQSSKMGVKECSAVWE